MKPIVQILSNFFKGRPLLDSSNVYHAGPPPSKEICGDRYHLSKSKLSAREQNKPALHRTDSSQYLHNLEGLGDGGYRAEACGAQGSQGDVELREQMQVPGEGGHGDIYAVTTIDVERH